MRVAQGTNQSPHQTLQKTAAEDPLVYYTNCTVRVHKCPPPYRFPPLREGNRVGRVGSPRFARGTKPIGSPCLQGEP